MARARSPLGELDPRGTPPAAEVLLRAALSEAGYKKGRNDPVPGDSSPGGGEQPVPRPGQLLPHRVRRPDARRGMGAALRRTSPFLSLDDHWRSGGRKHAAVPGGEPGTGGAPRLRSGDRSRQPERCRARKISPALSCVR
jgi:hypothetical protein